MDAIETAHGQAMERYAGEGVMYEGSNWGLGQKTHEQKRAEFTKQRNNALAAEADNLETHVSGEMEHTTVIEDVLGVGALAGVAAKAGVKTAAKVLVENTKPGKVMAQVGDGVPNGIDYTQLELRDAVQLDEFTRLNTKDIGGNARLRPGEAGAAVEIQNALGGQLRRAEAGEKGDFVFI